MIGDHKYILKDNLGIAKISLTKGHHHVFVFMLPQFDAKNKKKSNDRILRKWPYSLRDGWKDKQGTKRQIHGAESTLAEQELQQIKICLWH